jgi:hypothetical protein
MRSLRSLASLAPIIAAVGCASLPARQPAPASEITFDLAASPVQAREQLAAAFAANGLPVATSQPGVVEYHAARSCRWTAVLASRSSVKRRAIPT